MLASPAMFRSKFYLWVLLLVFSSYTLAASTQVLKPSEDPFYEVPENILDYAPGEVIRSRPAPAQLRSIYFPINIKLAHQVLFRSNDGDSNATAAVMTIMEPYNADPTKVLAYQVAEDAASIDCAPSYAYLYGASLGTILTQAEMILIEQALEEGWYVISADYQGPNSAFTAARQSGHIVLDSIRATLSTTNISGIAEHPQIAFWGYSGGSVACGWAAALQPSYAPELKPYLIGAALGGFVTNITATAVGVDGTLFAGVSYNAIAGLSNQYPEIREVIENQLIPLRKRAFQEAYNLCLVPSILFFMNKYLFSGPSMWFKSGMGVLHDLRVQRVMNLNNQGVNRTEIPEIPLFVYHGSIDTIVPIVGTHKVYDQWCEDGIESFEFAEDESGGHITEAIAGSGAAFAWLKNRFSGVPPIKGCNHTVRTTNFEYPGGYSSDIQIVTTLVLSVLGHAIGPNGENVDAGNSTSGFFESLSSLSDIGNLALSILFKRDMSQVELLEAKIEQHKRNF